MQDKRFYRYILKCRRVQFSRVSWILKNIERLLWVGRLFHDLGTAEFWIFLLWCRNHCVGSVELVVQERRRRWTDCVRAMNLMQGATCDHCINQQPHLRRLDSPQERAKLLGSWRRTCVSLWGMTLTEPTNEWKSILNLFYTHITVKYRWVNIHSLLHLMFQCVNIMTD